MWTLGGGIGARRRRSLIRLVQAALGSMDDEQQPQPAIRLQSEMDRRVAMQLVQQAFGQEEQPAIQLQNDLQSLLLREQQKELLREQQKEEAEDMQAMRAMAALQQFMGGSGASGSSVAVLPAASRQARAILAAAAAALQEQEPSTAADLPPTHAQPQQDDPSQSQWQQSQWQQPSEKKKRGASGGNGSAMCAAGATWGPRTVAAATPTVTATAAAASSRATTSSGRGSRRPTTPSSSGSGAAAAAAGPSPVRSSGSGSHNGLHGAAASPATSTAILAQACAPLALYNQLSNRWLFATTCMGCGWSCCPWRQRREQAAPSSPVCICCGAPATVRVATRNPSAPQWLPDGSSGQLSPVSGELRRRWPTYDHPEDRADNQEAEEEEEVLWW